MRNYNKRLLSVIAGVLIMILSLNYSFASCLGGNFRRMRIGLEFGYGVMDNKLGEEFRGGPGGGLFVGWDFSKIFSLDLVIGRIYVLTPKDKSFYVSGRVGQVLCLQPHINIFPSKKLTPFFLISIGAVTFMRQFQQEQLVIYYWDDPPDIDYQYVLSTMGFTTYFGAGYKYYIAEWFSIEGALTYHLNFWAKSKRNIFADDKGNFLNLTVYSVFHI